MGRGRVGRDPKRRGRSPGGTRGGSRLYYPLRDDFAAKVNQMTPLQRFEFEYKSRSPGGTRAGSRLYYPKRDAWPY